ncbi:hypothetical protein MN608_10910 [Microdochium nivale]|nr:hypothetical protein MN608_10910 [Microdochium nivale]
MDDLGDYDEPLYDSMTWSTEGQEIDVVTFSIARDGEKGREIEHELDDAEWWRQTAAEPATGTLDAYEAMPDGIPSWGHYLLYPYPGEGLGGSLVGAHDYAPQLDPMGYQSSKDDGGWIEHASRRNKHQDQEAGRYGGR